VSMCDLAVATTEARFALPGINVGVFCSTPVVGVLRNVHRKQAMEMLLTGDFVDAATALDRGLVNQVVAPDALDAAIDRYTDVIRARSRAVIGAGKQAFYRQADMSLADAYAVAGEAMTCNLGMADAQEGIDAFLAKRPAKWVDR
jgi:enoyl-CoA hydratase/carnithine racemase